MGCNQSQVDTTQQPVQRPVCIITACPAAWDRQTRLGAPSYKTQASHPIAETPAVQPNPARCGSEMDKQTPTSRQTARHCRKFLSEGDEE